MENELTSGLSSLNLQISKEQQRKLLQFVDLLFKWNKAYNLTAIRHKSDMLPLHIFDSLSILPFLNDAKKILDVGSGAGLPGIPLAIVCPDRNFVLLDGNGKKTRFIKQAIIELKLANVDVVHDRIENYQANTQFDCITTRAFATIMSTVKMTEHLFAESVRILFMKSNTADEELAEISNKYKKEIKTLNVPGIDAPRTLAIISHNK